jgi:DNA-binding PadR family transcriptional regulator
MKYLSRPEELILLTVWKLKDEAYGVKIRKYVQKMTGKYWSIGSIYVPLDRLENKGYLNSFMGEATSERGGKSKRYYQITQQGLAQLRTLQEIHRKFWQDLPDASIKEI